MTSRLHVLISGRVQGVGFRYATYHEAVARGLNGWVRNLPDSRVEALFEGPKEVLDHMLEWCRHGPRFADVTSVDHTWSEGDPGYGEFQLRM